MLGNVSSSAWVCCYAWAARFLRPIQQEFDSPIDLVPVSERALDDFGCALAKLAEVHLIPERPSGAGLQAFPSPVQDCRVPSGGECFSGRAGGVIDIELNFCLGWWG